MDNCGILVGILPMSEMWVKQLCFVIYLCSSTLSLEDPENLECQTPCPSVV